MKSIQELREDDLDGSISERGFAGPLRAVPLMLEAQVG